MIPNRKDQKQQRQPGGSAKSPSPRRIRASLTGLKVFGLEELNRVISALKVSKNSFVSVYNAFVRSVVDNGRFVLSIKCLNQRNQRFTHANPNQKIA